MKYLLVILVICSVQLGSAQYQYEANFIISDSSGYTFALYNTSHFELTRKEKKKFDGKSEEQIGREVGSTLRHVYTNEIRKAIKTVQHDKITDKELDLISELAMKSSRKAARKFGIKILHDPLDNLDVIGYPEIVGDFWKYTNIVAGYSIQLPRKFVKTHSPDDTFSDTTKYPSSVKILYLHSTVVGNAEQVFKMDAASLTANDSLIFEGIKVVGEDSVYVRQFKKHAGRNKFLDERYYYISRNNPLIVRFFFKPEMAEEISEQNAQIVESITVFKPRGNK